MRKLLIGLSVTVVSLTASSAAPARTLSTHTVSARSGGVSATFRYTVTHGHYTNETLQISGPGPGTGGILVTAKACGGGCAPAQVGPGRPYLHVVQLTPGTAPSVVLELFTGGAHCCQLDLVYTYDPRTMTYVRHVHNFGDPGATLIDLDHTGRSEFLSADDAFAYAFTDFAASGLPLRILRFDGTRFKNVTRAYPKLIAADAARWLKFYKSTARQHYSDSVGLIAAWAADEDELGFRRRVNRYLAAQGAAGHLNPSLGPSDPGGRRFIAKLGRFLRRQGYLR